MHISRPAIPIKPPKNATAHKVMHNRGPPSTRIHPTHKRGEGGTPPCHHTTPCTSATYTKLCTSRPTIPIKPLKMQPHTQPHAQSGWLQGGCTSHKAIFTRAPMLIFNKAICKCKHIHNHAQPHAQSGCLLRHTELHAQELLHKTMHHPMHKHTRISMHNPWVRLPHRINFKREIILKNT